VTLLVSQLPDVLFQELGGGLPAWLFWAKMDLICGALLASLFWKNLRALRLFFAVLLALYLIEWGADRFYQTLNYTNLLSGASSFVQSVGAVQIQRATEGILMLVVMLALVRRLDRFFFVKGKLDATAEPIPLIMDKPSSWRILGPFIAGAMCLGLLVFVFVFGGLPSTEALLGVLPLLPLVLIFAALNAFGEEMLYRAPWLAALEGPLGPVQALLITAAYFGIGHYYGVPYGVLGCVMAFIPGWLMGKAMLETRGFTWAWVIHFWMDVVIFFFMALGSVRPGG
jgi:membrane protease YdiL (CAAX protease family)